MSRLSERIAVVLVSSFVAVAASCGGSGGGTPTGGAGTGGVGTAAGTMTWKEGGKAHAATFANATRVKASTSDGLQLVGSESSGTALALGLLARMPPTLAPGSFSCANNAAGMVITSGSYTMQTTSSSGVPTACTIDLTTLGDATGSHTTGTFAATFSANGATQEVTDGKFDLPLNVTSL
jgi:hypothetical protein